MTLEEALDIVVTRTGHKRYMWLVSDDNPDEWQREAYRRIVLDMATGKEHNPPVQQVVPITGGCCGGNTVGY